ncbi:hypothetical protein EPUL_005519 [Erysiphe pulchra]|uniref:Endonuclease/exonuclease/phosphatase domain-containing protein n=1 Tax=Erysiphe pulchra TaxID=225359 RepID=A0A2S4PJR0_9PEZI|nr:hypothetical protein EPUL_005519 [Erysiphe pulchra]
MWNVYNAPINSIGAGECLKLLLETSVIVAGDFNLRHPMWDSFTTFTSQETTALIDWAREKDLSLLNPTDVSTHNRGGTLDFAFCSLVKAKCEITLDLHTTSDNETLVTTIPLNDLFLKILGYRQESSSIQTEEEAEIEAENIVKTIHTALLAACSRANTSFRSRQSIRMGHVKNEKRDLRNAVRRAKKEYWKSRVENPDNLPDFYKIVKWYNTASKFHTPLKDQSGYTLVFCPEKKAKLLHRVLLSGHMKNTDIPQNTPTATCEIESSSPGEDEITASVLRIAWLTLGKRITNLLNKCITFAVHPTAFERAEIFILSKPGKRDRTLPKSYRSLSLLSCCHGLSIEA